jgi:hypothetical protein
VRLRAKASALAERRAGVLECPDVAKSLGIHSLRVWNNTHGEISVEAERFTSRSFIVIPVETLEDTVKGGDLLRLCMENLAEHLHRMPIVDHDTGDEDRS